MGIGGGVCQHRRRQRARRPVGPLESLVHAYVQVLVQQCGESHARLPQKLGCDPGIEHRAGAKSKITVEDPEIVIGVVKHHLDRGIRQRLSDGREIAYAERVDHRRAGTGR